MVNQHATTADSNVSQYLLFLDFFITNFLIHLSNKEGLDFQPSLIFFFIYFYSLPYKEFSASPTQILVPGLPVFSRSASKGPSKLAKNFTVNMHKYNLTFECYSMIYTLFYSKYPVYKLYMLSLRWHWNITLDLKHICIIYDQLYLFLKFIWHGNPLKTTMNYLKS